MLRFVFFLLCFNLYNPLSLAESSQQGLLSTNSVVSNSLTSSLDGEVRWRSEQIDQENQPLYNQNRLRVKLNYFREVNARTTVKIGLASGTGSATSNFFNLDNAGADKNIYFDVIQATVKYSFGYFYLGKITQPFYRPSGSDLVWDSDYTPEGLAVSYYRSGLFAHLGEFILSNSSTSLDDVKTQRLQMGYNLNWGQDHKLTFGLGGFAHSPLKQILGSKSLGNSTQVVGSNTEYLYKFEIVHAFIVYHCVFGSVPLEIFYDRVQNNAAPKDNLGWSTGLVVSSLKHSWKVNYQYKYLEKDAINIK
ncbi:MAG: putative porin [Bdellovibrionales bacterium]|nr:putative porin [Bdellovibrionales bacterium]